MSTASSIGAMTPVAARRMRTTTAAVDGMSCSDALDQRARPGSIGIRDGIAGAEEDVRVRESWALPLLAYSRLRFHPRIDDESTPALSTHTRSGVPPANPAHCPPSVTDTVPGSIEVLGSKTVLS